MIVTTLLEKFGNSNGRMDLIIAFLILIESRENQFNLYSKILSSHLILSLFNDRNDPSVFAVPFVKGTSTLKIKYRVFT